MRFEVLILGCGSALPTLERNPGGQVVNLHEQLYLLDCGEGTQHELRKHKIKIQRIDHIFISHLHGDHFFGLIGLVSTLNLLGRQKELTIYAPSGLKQILSVQLEASDSYLRFPLHFVETSPKKGKTLLFENKTTEIYSIPLKHRIDCTGFLVSEKPAERKINPEAIKLYNIPRYMLAKIKAGENFTAESGEVITNEKLTYPADSPRSYAYCSDTAYYPELTSHIKQVDVLYHEATFLETLKDRAKQTFQDRKSVV